MKMTNDYKNSPESLVPLTVHRGLVGPALPENITKK